jgi:hypothetical protein
MKKCLIVWLLLATTKALAQPSLLVLDFEMVDEMHDPAAALADRGRLERSGPQLREALAGCAAFRLVDPAPSRAAVERAASQNAYVYRCNACAPEIARSTGADLIALTWVQKVSNLILNFNIEVRDGRSEAIIAAKSVDVRGNTDQSWSRGVRALGVRICESATRLPQ